MRLIASSTTPGSVRATAAARSSPFRSCVRHERFEGTILSIAAGGRDSAVAHEPLQNKVAAALSEGDLLNALSTCYGQELQSFPLQVMFIRRAETTGAFISDRWHRCHTLELLCRQNLDQTGLLALYPPALQWRPAGAKARFLRRVQGQDLLLCALLGELGFGQLCDDRLQHPVPLLIQPWCEAQGLLRPVQLPRKSFSQSLYVQRLDRRRLLLFDKGCLITP